MQKSCGWDGLTDEELVRLSQSGDTQAFSELARRNYGTSIKLATSILREREGAEDEVQNAYCKAFQHINQFQIEARFSTWMTRIVVNQCLMRLRRLRRARMVFIDDLHVGEDRTPIELPDEGLSPESLLGSSELAAVLKTEIRRIPPLLRNVFMLRDVEELSMREVADTLGISVPAAKSRLLRARAELRIRLEKHCGAWRSGNLKSFGAIV